MRFKVIDKTQPKRPVSGKWYMDQEGKLYRDCDPHGVDMRGKLRISGAPNNFYAVGPSKTECSGDFNDLFAWWNAYGGDLPHKQYVALGDILENLLRDHNNFS